MTADEFWDHIRATRRRDPEEHVERLVARLAKLPADEISAFGRVWYERLAAAYTNRLWGAAYLINGGCSDDGFEYFRNWLMLQGRRVYEAALADPDTLADVVWEPDEAEHECYPAQDAYARATGADINATYAALGKLAPDREADLGESWDFDDEVEMKRRYPRLFARCYPDG